MKTRMSLFCAAAYGLGLFVATPTGAEPPRILPGAQVGKTVIVDSDDETLPMLKVFQVPVVVESEFAWWTWGENHDSFGKPGLPNHKTVTDRPSTVSARSKPPSPGDSAIAFDKPTPQAVATPFADGESASRAIRTPTFEVARDPGSPWQLPTQAPGAHSPPVLPAVEPTWR